MNDNDHDVARSKAARENGRWGLIGVMRCENKSYKRCLRIDTQDDTAGRLNEW